MKNSKKFKHILYSLPLVIFFNTFPLGYAENLNQKNKPDEIIKLFEEEFYEEDIVLYNSPSYFKNNFKFNLLGRTFFMDRDVEYKFLQKPEMKNKLEIKRNNFRFNLVSKAKTNLPLRNNSLDDLIWEGKTNHELIKDKLKSKEIISYSIPFLKINIRPYYSIELDFTKKYSLEKNYRNLPRISSKGYGFIFKSNFSEIVSFSASSSLFKKFKKIKEEDEKKFEISSKIEIKNQNKKIRYFIKKFGIEFELERKKEIHKAKEYDDTFSIKPFVKFGNFLDKFKMKFETQKQKKNKNKFPDFLKIKKINYNDIIKDISWKIEFKKTL